MGLVRLMQKYLILKLVYEYIFSEQTDLGTHMFSSFIIVMSTKDSEKRFVVCFPVKKDSSRLQSSYPQCTGKG